MSQEHDEFDLDIRIEWTPAAALAARNEGLRAGPADTEAGTCDQVTCAVNTCGTDCFSQECNTAGCNTEETCDQQVDSCSPIACGDTFGPYCIAPTDPGEGCEGGGGASPGCPDPEPGEPSNGCVLTNPCH